MNKYKLIILSICFCCCGKSPKSDAKDVVLEEVKCNIKDNTAINYDAVVSTWYIYQYSAIEDLENLTAESANIGNKTTDDPVSILNKQKTLALRFREKFQSDEKLSSWSELQQICAENLCSSLSYEFHKAQDHLTPIGKAMYYIDLQYKLLEVIGYK